MIAEKLETCAKALDRLIKGNADDFRAFAPFVVSEMRREAERVKKLENDVFFRDNRVTFEVRGITNAAR